MLGITGQAERRGGGQDRILTSRHVTIMPGRGGEVVMASTTNLGPGGMLITSETPFAVGDRFICKIDLGDTYKPVLSGGEVRWIGRSLDDAGGGVGIGVKFLDIAEAAQTLGGELPTRGPEAVRVRLESVASALDADVIERSNQELVLDVELPFLQPGAQVEVGHDLSARTAAIRQVEWSADDGDESIKVRLWLDLEPSAADRVVQDATRDRLRQRRSSPAPEVHTTPERRPSVEEARVEPPRPTIVTPPPREPEPVSAAAETAEEPWAEPDPSYDEPEEPAELVPDRPAKDAVQAEDSSASAEDRPACADPAEGSKPAAKVDYDDLNLNTMFPFWGALESVLGKQRCMRLVAVVAAAYASVKARMKPEALRALATVARERLGRGWSWTRERLGPAMSRLGPAMSRLGPAMSRLGPAMSRIGSALHLSKLAQRRRRQVKGEPSRVVRSLTDRARRVAAGKGKAIAVAVLVALSVAGLATAGLGLAGSRTAERDREQLQSEATSAGWAAEQWQEPEPARADAPNPS